MLNLIPVVMLLLMQGTGGSDLTLRQQQALLDLAQRVQLAQEQREIGTAFQSEQGVATADLAHWLNVFYAAPARARATEPASAEPNAPIESQEPAKDVADPECARPRDGPVAA